MPDELNKVDNRARVKAICDEMMARLDNPISPSGRYGLSEVMKMPSFTGLTDADKDRVCKLFNTRKDEG